MGAVIQLSTSYETLTCYKCGIQFGAPVHWVSTRRADQEPFWCPNGHSQAFTGSELDRVKRELEREKQQRAEAEGSRDRAWRQRDLAQRQARSERTRRRNLQKRIAAGVCPCCHRTFQQLARHMEKKHPDFAKHAVLEAITP